MSRQFTFVDLFAGIGGFHAALTALGGQCAYAIEIDANAAAIYERNWGLNPLGDITYDASDAQMVVPPHDVLAAGFPCQPFSKTGGNRGMDEARGTLFWNIMKVVETHKPAVVLLENVRNLIGPRHVHEWHTIIASLRGAGYWVSDRPAVISPHCLSPGRGGRPQVRERAFLTATYVGGQDVLDGLGPDPIPSNVGPGARGIEWRLTDYLVPDVQDPRYQLTEMESHWISAWDDWVRSYRARNGGRIPGFPIWADSWLDLRNDDVDAALARLKELEPGLPEWKASNLAKNYDLYSANRHWIDGWARRWSVYGERFPASRRKLEWQAQDTASLWDTVMHMRPSGIRAKPPTYVPALVAITQTSIYGPQRRRLTPREGARLMGFADSFTFGSQRDSASYKQLGNAVSVGAVWHAMREHVDRDADLLRRTPEGSRILDSVRAAPGSPDHQHQPGPPPAASTPPSRRDISSTAMPAAVRRSRRDPAFRDTPYFVPAGTTGEATARIFGLTGAPPAGRGEKRALVALRDALGLDVDVVRTNAVMGQQLAHALDVDWDPDAHTIKNKVTLAGLNALLEGASQAYQRRALGRVPQVPPTTLTGAGWSAFEPAVSKIEAVTRIARLTSAPPEWLGPGSKEHKSVLLNLADALLPEARLDRSSKTRLGRSIAEALDVGWNDTCYSTGETISLIGLNTILAGAERRLDRLGTTAADLLADPAAEGAALAAALHDGWSAATWDARETVEWLRDNNLRGANDNEWQGWFFEARGRELLNAAFPPSRQAVRLQYGRTTFDYSLNHPWDLKAHTEVKVFADSRREQVERPVAILNDVSAVRECVSEQGLGFLVLSGSAVMDESGEFVRWHRSFKAQGSGRLPALSNSGQSRQRKSGFTPLRLEAFWVADTLRLDEAVASGQLAARPQGRQAPKGDGSEGSAREDKFHMNLERARTGSILASGRQWTAK
ncbi:DNA cytosine methyltransferase [Nocardioides dongxiaopingii]|uniref:DNA (cytosine-5-)-methyltransferase n=1 Tax=Nocardioides sp. S-1144 TaxID=2582905 RepID=UPI00110E1FEA|nr:DNA (cytosine-5-)-methyltransferase [Nocardioides sp. S-1144]QCW51016.1 DNA cytosine methyltransferase [Nocardioides sp. S-1144]